MRPLKTIPLILVLSVLLFCTMPSATFAQADDGAVAEDPALELMMEGDVTEGTITELPPDEYVRAEIISIESGDGEGGGVYRVRVLNGDDAGTEQTIEVSDITVSGVAQRATAGDTVVLVRNVQYDGQVVYYLADHYRLPSLLWLVAAFFALAVVFGGWRGLTAMLGLVASVLVIVYVVVPGILAGTPPFTVTMVAALLIAAVSLFLAHGFNLRTTIAFIATIITLGASAMLASQAVRLASLNGLGDEQASYLVGGTFGHIDLRGLLLAGIILGVLGVLDDITTAQSAVVEELKHANPKFGFVELYRRGLSVGREHIASLVNTLFLAYAGVSLPLFLLFTINQDQPTWFVLNGEMLAEEVVRTVVGSACLIIAVPLTTAIAAAYWGSHEAKEGLPESMHHH